jgi:hypothetical protein
MRKSHVVTLGLGVGMAGAAMAFAGCGTNTFGTCQDDNACGDGGSDGSLDGTTDVVTVMDSPSGSDGHVGDGGSDGPSAADGAKDAPSETSLTCEAGTVMCSGSCVDTSTDPNNCGGCGKGCTAPTNGTATCADGTDGAPACGFACNSMFHSCNGACDPNSDTPSMSGSDPCILTTAFGVFVSPAGSDTSGNGSPTEPFQTIGHAMDIAVSGGTKRVYACGSAGPYTLENLNVGMSRNGVSVYGGLDCTTTPAAWTYNATDVASVTPTAAGYALQVSALVTGTTFEDFAFTSQASSGAGVSSIAVFVSNSMNVAFTRVAMTAGDASAAVGASGASGGTTGDPSNYYSGNLNGNNGSPGTGALVQPCMCQDNSTSTGGSGGDSGHSPGAGTPNIGGGQAGTNSEACNTAGASGSDGANAAMGTADTPSASLGTLSATGWTPATGMTGSNGKVGQGGGGGGDGAQSTGGGGGGGCGGCGGVGGAPGGGGGSSIALLSFDSGVTLAACGLTAHNAALGGLGGGGEQGQGGGAFGTGGGTGCPGGIGGAGAGGNGAQGGPGGLSLGVGYVGNMPAADSQTTGAIQIGNAGGGGGKGIAGLAGGLPLGNPGVDGAIGQAGTAQPVLLLQ